MSRAQPSPSLAVRGRVISGLESQRWGNGETNGRVGERRDDGVGMILQNDMMAPVNTKHREKKEYCIEMPTYH